MTDGAQQGGMDAADPAAPREDVPVRDEVPAPAPPVEKELPSLAPPVEDDGENNPGNNLHIASLSRQAKDEDLRELFERYGPLTKVQAMRDPHSGEPRGFGFVTFERVEDADAAVQALNGHELLGRPITVQRARRARARGPTPGQYLGPPKRGGGGAGTSGCVRPRALPSSSRFCAWRSA